MTHAPDVQLEHGYVRLANRLLEALCDSELSGTQVRIVLALWRHTYGWQEEAVSLTLSDLASKCRCSGTGGFRRAFDELVQNGVVVAVVESGRGVAGTFRVQKNFAKWGRFSISEQRLAALWDERPEHVAVEKEKPAKEPKPKPEKKQAPTYVTRAVEIWAEERGGGILDHGVVGAHLKPVVKLLGDEETMARWTNYCRTTKDHSWANPAHFKTQHPLYAATEKRAGPDRAALLWNLYVKNGLTKVPTRTEVERLAARLVAEGDYPSAGAFLDELRVTEPWTLKDARSDQWAIQQVAARLGAA